MRKQPFGVDAGGAALWLVGRLPDPGLRLYLEGAPTWPKWVGWGAGMLGCGWVPGVWRVAKGRNGTSAFRWECLNAVCTCPFAAGGMECECTYCVAALRSDPLVLLVLLWQVQ